MHGPKFGELGEMWSHRQTWNEDKLMLDMTHCGRLIKESDMGGIEY